MKKLKLNKKTISVLDKAEMGEIDGGFTCIGSCNNASQRGKGCCNSGRVVISISGRDNYRCTNAKFDKKHDYVLVEDKPVFEQVVNNY